MRFCISIIQIFLSDAFSKSFIICPLLFIFIACMSPKRIPIYMDDLSNEPIDSITKSYSDAINNIEAIPLVHNKQKTVKIDKDDPVIFLNDSLSTRSNFKLFKFKGQIGRKYKIGIRSSSFEGMVGSSKKYIMIPKLLLLDHEGNVICEEAVEYEPYKGRFSYKIFMLYKGVFPKTDTYYVLVMADNRYAGIYSGDFDSITFTPDFVGFRYIPLSIPFYGSPFGKFSINLQSLH